MSRSNLMKAVLCFGLGAFVLGRPAPAEAAAARLESSCIWRFYEDRNSCDFAAENDICPDDCEGPAVCANFENGHNNVLSCQGAES